MNSPFQFECCCHFCILKLYLDPSYDPTVQNVVLHWIYFQCINLLDHQPVYIYSRYPWILKWQIIVSYLCSCTAKKFWWLYVIFDKFLISQRTPVFWLQFAFKNIKSVWNSSLLFKMVKRRKISGKQWVPVKACHDAGWLSHFYDMRSNKLVKHGTKMSTAE